MPKEVVKPALKLTKAQWEELLRRLLARKGKFTAGHAKKLMEQVEPVEEIRYGTLWKPMEGDPSVLTPIRLPIEKARELYQAAPEEYVLRPVGPAAKELISEVPAKPGVDPEEFARGVVYRWAKEAPIKEAVPETSIVKKELLREEREKQLRSIGLTVEDIRPGVKIETVLEEVKGFVPEPQLPPAADMAALAAKAAELWRFGKGSMIRQMFDQYRQAASWAKTSPYIKNAKDYFISCYTRYHKDPDKFAKSSPREAKMIRWLEEQYDAALKFQRGD